MTLTSEESFESHSEALQVPLYVAGMLDHAERDQMERHLEHCTSCQKDVEEEQRLQPVIQEALEGRPSPSVRVLQRAKQKIAERSSPKFEKKVSEPEPSLGLVGKLEEWIRNLFLPRWVPTLALLVILVQGSVLQYLLTSAPGSRPPGMDGPIMERELPPTIVNKDLILRIEVTFLPNLSIESLQSLLQDVKWTMERSPGSTSKFVMTLEANRQQQLDEALQVLKESRSVQEIKSLPFS